MEMVGQWRWWDNGREEVGAIDSGGIEGIHGNPHLLRFDKTTQLENILDAGFYFIVILFQIFLLGNGLRT
jgi:hypothetical protein